MDLEFEGEFEVNCSREEAYEFLTDPEKFAPAIPKFQNLKFNGSDKEEFTIEVKIGVSQISGIATIKLTRVEDEYPEHVTYEGTGSIVAGSVDLTAEFDVKETDSGTTLVKWSGEPDVSGRIVSVAGGLLKPLAQRNIEKAIERVPEAMEEQS